MIRAHSKTTEKVNPAYKRFKEEAKHLKSGAYVSIGVHEGAGAYPDGESVINVALWNEFGTDTIPERSFIRSAIDGNEPLINKWREDFIKEIVDGKTTAEKALEAIGFRIRELIKNKIGSNVPPPYGTGKKPNSAERISQLQQAKKNKGEAPRTLIASTLLLRSIEYRVVLK